MQPNRTFLKLGDRWLATMPYSEVCMHMRIADKKMICEFAKTIYPMIQLYSLDGKPFSSPVTTGEAGVYEDAKGFYTYGEVI